MHFETEAQKACFEKVKTWLAEIFGEMQIARHDVPGFAVMVGSAIAHVLVAPWGEDQSVVTMRAYVVTNIAADAELTRFLLAENANLVFGGFGIDEAGDIVFDHAIVGSTADRDGLRAAILAVVLAADRYDDEIVERWGGERALDRSN